MSPSLRFSTLALALAALCAPGLAWASNYPDGGVGGAEVSADLQSIGLKVKEDKDPTGDPLLRVAIPLKDVEVPYTVFFFDCRDARCATIEFHASFDGKADKIAEWNVEHRYGRAYLANDKVNIDYDVDVERGANSDQIRNAAARFKSVLIEAVTFLGNY